jgi:hypothetical protein
MAASHAPAALGFFRKNPSNVPPPPLPPPPLPLPPPLLLLLLELVEMDRFPPPPARFAVAAVVAGLSVDGAFRKGSPPPLANGLEGTRFPPP